MVIKSVAISLVTGSIFSFLPSLGPSQAAVFSSLITKEESRESYLMLIGALNSISMIISLITFYAIQKARNGAIVAIATILPNIDMSAVLLFTAVTLLICYPVTYTTIVLSKKFSQLITRVNYQMISIAIIIMIISISLWLSGPISIIVMLAAAALGFVPQLKNISRNHLMGCLMLSTIMWYFV